LLGQLEGEGRIVVADFEAGLGTLTRVEPKDLDVLLIVVEPTAKSVEVARRAVELARERGIGRALVVANRIAGPEDRQLAEASFAGLPLLLVEDDPALRLADVQGLAPFDHAPDAPAVRAIRGLAETLA
jgi:CO dehydrogenase maturation factor